jgi:putative ABC transport system permease protein
MGYSLTTLWFERTRYVPGVLAVAFSALLIFLQWGLMFGLFSLASVPIDHAEADLWVGDADVRSVDLGRPIPRDWETRVATEAGVIQTEPYIMFMVPLDKGKKRSELCAIVGTRLGQGALGPARELPLDLRALLSEPGAVAMDESDLEGLGLTGIGDTAEIFNHRIRIVGLIKGGKLKSIATPYLWCSLDTAQMVLSDLEPNETVFILARCAHPEAAPLVAQRLRDRYPDMSTFTSQEFSQRTQHHWLTTTRAGIATGWAAALGLMVGLAITSQTLYAATAAARREYAVLEALGIPRWRMCAAVLAQSFWVGILGLGLALPAAFGLAEVAEKLGAPILFLPWLLIGASACTLAMALLSGLGGLWSLRLIEPAELLR